VRETPYQGPERRRSDRSPPPAPRVLGRARVRPEHCRHALSLAPGTWYALIEQPADLSTQPLEGYVWIDLDGRPQSIWAVFLEIERR
jgi:hypothetical protein